MELRYTRHAIAQMAKRHITEEMVEFVLMHPRWMPVAHNTRYDAVLPDGRRLAVVVAEEHDPAVVVTAMWASEEEGE